METRQTIVGRAAALIATACLAVIALTSAFVITPSLRTLFATHSTPSGIAIGERLVLVDDPPSVGRRSVLIFARSTCEYSEKAKPTLRKVISRVAERTDARVALILTDTELVDGPSYAESLGLTPEAVIPYGIFRGRLRRVPAVVIVDNDGKVVFSEIASSRESLEADFVSAVERALR